MDSTPTIDTELFKRSVNYHGQQLQKIWESEKGEGDLSKIGNIEFDFKVYQERQKNLSFQDRGKRLKIQHFIARHVDQLFDANSLPTTVRKASPSGPGKPLAPGEEDHYAILPPYESFLPLDKAGRLQHFYQCVVPGELLICSITSKASSGMMLKVLCTDSTPFRYVADLNVKAYCPAAEMPPGGLVTDKKGINRALMHNEAVRVELMEVVPDSEKMVVSMMRSKLFEATAEGSNEASPSTKSVQLGLVYTEDLPVAYKRCQERKSETYSELLERSLGFSNPSNTELLATKAGIDHDTSPSFLKTLLGRFPMEEYAQELRQVQASKWAFKSVADGITHFKASRHSEAFQCLNRALSIDRRNVEGLVARGALYANSGSFDKAIEDFENALKLNQHHQNARKYMGETLVAQGRMLEDDDKLDEALKSYERCLTLVPFHEEAQSSILYLENKMRSAGTASAAAAKMSQDPHAINPSASATDALLPGLSTTKSLEVKATLKQLLKAEQEDKGRSSRSKKKKDRKRKSRRRSRKHHRRDRSSSSSSSSSSGSASSSSSSSSSSGSGSSGDRASSHSGSAFALKRRSKSKKHQSKESHREKSLSPLSKRMALMETSHDSDGLAGLMTQRMSQYNSSALPYSFDDSTSLVKAAGLGVPPIKETEYDPRIHSFILEHSKEDPDYGEKLRKFLEESTKLKKERKAQEKDGKKKKKKDKSKSRDKEKGKKKKSSKDDEKRRKRRGRKSALSELAGEFGDGPGLVEQLEHLEGLDEGGRRLVKEVLLQKLGKSHRRTAAALEGSESSSDDANDAGPGMVFSSLKKQQQQRDKTSDLSSKNAKNSKKFKKSRMLGEIPDLGDLESKLSAYYAKIEKDKGISKRGEEKEKKALSRSSLVAYPSPIGKPVKSSSNAGGVLSPKLPYHIQQHLGLEDDEEEELEKSGNHKRHCQKRKMDIFADSPSPPSKPKLSLTEATNIVSSKWKMQITPTNSKVKRREQSDKEPWEDIEEKRFIFIKEEGEASSGGEAENTTSRRRARRGEDERRAKDSPPPMAKQEAYYDKFSGFRIARKDDPTKMDPSSILPAKAPPTPVPAPLKDVGKGPKTDSESETDPRKKLAKAKSRSRSKSSTSRSRGRSSASSGSGKRRRRSRSHSYRRRSRSGSYRYGSRSRSRSYYRSSRSRSRSRSYDRDRSRSRSYYSRSRSGSRDGDRRRSSDYYRRGSRSPDRYRRYDNQRNMHRYPRQRGTYYRPRFQGYKNPRGGFVPRGRFISRGGRPFIPRGRGRGRPRFFHYGRPGGGYRPDRPDHHRRYSDSRERSRNSEDRRSYDGDRERERDPDRDRDRERDRARRDDDHKSEDGGPPKRDRDHMNEERPDEDYGPKTGGDYIDRKMFEGKWAEDKEEEKRRSEAARRIDDDLPPPPGTSEPLPENSIEEMDKFLNKVKAQKKEELKERSKAFKRPIVF